MSQPGQQHDKTMLRKEMLARRQSYIAPVDWMERLTAAAAPILDRPAGIIAGYLPIRGEADPMPLMRLAVDKGWQLALPRMEGQGVMHFHAWLPGDMIVPGPYGIGEPEAGAPQVEPDVVLVPLVAFDRRLYRLGYGGGYYDRALPALKRNHPAAVTVGIAYAWQEVPVLPCESYDVPLDYCIAL